MHRILIPALILTALAGCAETEAPLAHGRWQVLNAGQWDINPALVTVPPMPEGKH